MITVPTRVTDSTFIIIDYIYTTDANNSSEIEVPCIGLSDHYTDYFERKFKTSAITNGRHKNITHRGISN